MNQWGNDWGIMQMIGPNMAPGPQMGPGLHMGAGLMGPGPNMGPGPIGQVPNLGAGVMGPGPALLPTPMPGGPPAPDAMVPILAPPPFQMTEWSQGHQNKGPGEENPSFIGPKKPDPDLTGVNQENQANRNINHGNSRHVKDNRDHKDGWRDFGDRDKDRSRRPRSPNNRSKDIRDRNDNRDRSDRSRGERREKRQRWGDKDNQGSDVNMGNNIMMHGNNIMQYGNMLNQPGMDMNQMQQIPGMIPNMMPGMMNMMPGLSMMPGMNNMMDQGMMMMQQMPNQPIYLTNAVLMPPLPQTSLPSRRERPVGCRTIFVGGLPHGIGEDVIKEIFQRFGAVDDVKLHKQGVCHVRFHSQNTVEASFCLSGFRFRRLNEAEHEATTLFIDYSLNREDQNEYERNKRKREVTPPRIEPYSLTAFSAIAEKIKSDTDFVEAAPTLAGWLERGECNKKNANAFYSLIQAANNQIRRLYTEKMNVDEEFQTLKNSLRDKFAHIILQFEQVGKILTAAKIQRVSDHFSKQQRRNIEMWLKMTEDVENIKEEFNTNFEEDESDDKTSKGAALLKKYEELKTEHENLQYELEGYKNEVHLAKDEAERRFEKFKAHFIAEQALQGKPAHTQQAYPPLPPPPLMPAEAAAIKLPPSILPSEAKLISILTAFLLVHPLGATLDYLVSYVRSIVPTATQTTIHNILQSYSDVFSRQTSGVGANIETKWTFVTYDIIKKETDLA